MAQDNRNRFNLDKENEKPVAPVPEEVGNTAEEAKNEMENLKEVSAPQPLPEEKASRGWVKASFWIMGILLVVILVMLWKFCDRQEEKPATLADTPTELAAAADAVDSVAQEVGESVAEPVAAVGDAVASGAEKASAVVGETVEKASSAAGEVAEKASSAATAVETSVSSDIQKEALNVIKGAYGNGAERRRKLGAQYQEIQNRVNQLKRQGAF